MTGYTTQVVNNDYRIMVETTSPEVFQMIIAGLQRCLDWETGHEYAEKIERERRIRANVRNDKNLY